MLKNRILGLWPRKGANRQIIISRVWAEMGKTISWGETPVCGFPSMSPCEVGLEAFGIAQSYHPNAILCHTFSEGEKGFDGIKGLEREVVVRIYVKEHILQ